MHGGLKGRGVDNSPESVQPAVGLIFTWLVFRKNVKHPCPFVSVCLFQFLPVVCKMIMSNK